MSEHMTNEMQAARTAVRDGGLSCVVHAMIDEMRTLNSQKSQGSERGEFLVVSGRLAGMERRLTDPWTVHDPNFEVGFAAMMRRVADGRQEDASDTYRGTLAALADREVLRGQGLDDRVHRKRRIELEAR